MEDEVEGRRVGVRWEPPTLIYVYRTPLRGLRLARLPLRNLYDGYIVDKLYLKHDDLLRGLDRRYVERMVDIVRHHYGIDTERASDPHESGVSDTSAPDQLLDPHGAQETDTTASGGGALLDRRVQGRRKENGIKTATDKGGDREEDQVADFTSTSRTCSKPSGNGDDRLIAVPPGPGPHHRQILDSITRDRSRVRSCKEKLLSLVTVDPSAEQVMEDETQNDSGDKAQNDPVNKAQTNDPDDKAKNSNTDNKAEINDPDDKAQKNNPVNTPLDPVHLLLDDDDFWS